MYSDKGVHADSDRKTPEINGIWKQYSNLSGDVQPTSFSFSVETIGYHRKNSETSHPEYCFHVPLISGIFLQVSVKSA
jgi:hypothetical protein